MRRKDRQIRICAVLLILNLGFIWGNSLLPAEVSQALSDWVKGFLTVLSSGEPGPSSGSGLLRKIAHFTEFTALGLLLSWLFILLQKKRWYPLPLGMAAAGVDETIQFFVPGRSPGIMDVGIDTCGVLTGMLLLQIGYLMLRRTQPISFGGQQK